jgi:hypothetical protein
MILLSPDAVLDVEHGRTFLGKKNLDAAKRVLRAILCATELTRTPQIFSSPAFGMDVRRECSARHSGLRRDTVVTHLRVNHGADAIYLSKVL